MNVVIAHLKTNEAADDRYEDDGIVIDPVLHLLRATLQDKRYDYEKHCSFQA
jgi:hypothetical protein